MPSQHTPTTKPERRFTPEELFRSLERNRGRLQAVEYACFGLANGSGKDAACLTWILDDVLTDLDSIGNALEDFTLIEGGNKEIPIPTG